MRRIDVLRAWPARRWAAALLGALIVGLVVALPTAVIPNPVFGRAVEVTWWSYPTVLISAVLGGLLLASYVRVPAPGPADGADDGATGEQAEVDRASKLGMAGGFIAFFAVGCPVCNKLVLLALGASGAMSWFAPVQPFLAVASIGLMAYALWARLGGEVACSVPVGREVTRP